MIISFNAKTLIKPKIKEKFKRVPLIKKMDKFYKAYSDYRKHKRLIVVFVLLSCLEQFAPVLGNYIASCALGFSIPFLYFLAVIPIVQLFTRIPISFNGIGVHEGLLVFFFGILHLGKTDAFTIGLVGHIAILISVIPAVTYYSSKFLFKKKIKIIS